jgi:cytochrome bd ubiquinol oxidase subunit II
MVLLQTIWFVLVGVLLAGYAVLDGFDLGAGALYPFVAKTEEEKDIVRSSVGPVWDGNEVWLLAGGGALFAAFPPVYATVFSGFYLALMLVLFALLFRAVSFEFRAQDPKWHAVWDWSFFLGSLLPALLFGVAAGNIVRGVPLTAAGEYAAGFFDLLNPYALVAGVTGLVFFIAHGAGWLSIKTDGELRERVSRIQKPAQYAYVALLAVLALTTWLVLPQRFFAVLSSPVGWLGIALAWAGVVAAIVFTGQGRDRFSFYGTAASVVGLVVMWAAAIFPNILPSLGPGASMSIYTVSSSQLTLTVMLVIALIGVPIMLAYTALVYSKFVGKTPPHGEGY